MAFFSDAQETTDRYGSQIADYQELFRKHEIAFGTPEDFFQLAPKLAYDEEFRAAFCALTKKVSERERGRLTLTRMLTIIGLAMGGKEIEARGSASAVPISLVVVFLAGVGGWSETEVPVNEPVYASTAMEAGGGRSEEIDEAEALELEQRLSAGGNDLEGLTASLFGGPAMVKEALSRLEINTLELKLHLDSIDHRMERIEPHLDDLTARIGPKMEPVYPGAAEKNGTSTGERNGKGALPARRYSQPDTMVMPLAEPVGVVVVKPTAVVSSAAAVSSKEIRRLKMMVGALALLLVVMAGATSWLLYSSQGKRLMQAEESKFAGLKLVEAVRGSTVVDTGGTHGLDAAGRGGGTNKVGTAANPPVVKDRGVEARPASGAVVQPVAESTPVAIPTVVNTPGKIHPTKDETPLPAGATQRQLMSGGMPGGGMPIAEPSRPVVTAAAAAPSPFAGVNVPVPPNILFVPAAELRRFVLADPKPNYPAIAKFQRMEGDVLVQALISQTGEVESVGAVSGPALLEHEAVDTMRRWKFKPYLVNGQPVKVRTYVKFHFSLNR